MFQIIAAVRDMIFIPLLTIQFLLEEEVRTAFFEHIKGTVLA